MNLADIPHAEISVRLKSGGLGLRAGLFTIKIRTNEHFIAKNIHRMYADAELIDDGFFDFHIELNRSSGIRKLYRPSIAFSFCGQTPFAPLPLEQGYALLEWGLNWCTSNHCHNYLLIHAAIIEKNNKALILPGAPGSGKSTLCAALILKGGWRLLSDELTIIDLNTYQAIPNPRPVSLKNDSIATIRCFDKKAIFSDIAYDTLKGTVAHMRPPAESIIRHEETATPAIIVFPKYSPNVSTEIHKSPKGQAFLELANQSFNYSILGESGFNTIGKILDQCNCYCFDYAGNLDEAIKVMDDLLIT